VIIETARAALVEAGLEPDAAARNARDLLCVAHPDAAETPTWMSDLLKVRFVTPARDAVPGQAACSGSGAGYAGSAVHSGHGGIAEPALCSHTFSPGPACVEQPSVMARS